MGVAELHLVPGTPDGPAPRAGAPAARVPEGPARPGKAAASPARRPAAASADPEDATLEFASESPDGAPVRSSARASRPRHAPPPKQASVRVDGGGRRVPLALVAAGGLLAGSLAMWAVLADGPAPPPPAAPPPPTEGVLVVDSDPVGATVRIDGEPRGVTPLSVTLAAGPHLLTLEHEDVVEETAVEIEAGARASRHVTWTELPAPPPPPWGWISVSSPVPTRVVLGDQTIGTDGLDRILLPPGTPRLQFVSEPYGFRQTRTGEVRAGEAAPLRVSVPEASISIDAQPWAEVFINGERIGDTPLANVMRPLGDYEVVLRHPLFGERRLIARARLGESARVAVDMRPRQE
jgi:hypothetical protein